jgi:hypothetical protein
MTNAFHEFAWAVSLLFWMSACAGDDGGGSGTPSSVAGGWSVTATLVSSSAPDLVYAEGERPRAGKQQVSEWIIEVADDGSLTLTSSMGVIVGQATADGAHFEHAFPSVDLTAYGSPGATLETDLVIDCFVREGGMTGTEQVHYTVVPASAQATIPNGMESWTFEATPL